MGTAQEVVVQEFMDAWGDGTQEEPDIEKILSMFSDDAVWQLWVPGGPTLQGREATRADIERQLRFATFMRCGPVHITSNDRVVFTERVDHFLLQQAVELNGGTGVSTSADILAGLAKFNNETLGGITGGLSYSDPTKKNQYCYFTIVIKNQKFTLPAGAKPSCVAKT